MMLLDVNGNPLKATPPAKEHLMEFFAWETLGYSLPPVLPDGQRRIMAVDFGTEDKEDPMSAELKAITETSKVNPLVSAWAGGSRMSVDQAKARSASGLRPFKKGDTLIRPGDDLPIIWQGETGVGKTEAGRQLAEENGWDFAQVNFGGTDEQCNTGLPVLTEEGGRKVMSIALPEYLPCFNHPPKSASGVGILLLDEMFSGATPQHQAFARAMLDRQVGSRRMLPGWAVIGTTNPIGTLEYGLAVSDDITLPNRAIIMNVHTNEEETYSWWRSRGMNSRLLSFLLAHSLRKVSIFRAKDPRGWWKLGLLFDAWEAAAAPPAWYVEQLHSACGEHGGVVSRAWMGWITDGENPENQILHMEDLLRGEPAEYAALLSRVEGWIKRDRHDLVSALNWDMMWWVREKVLPVGSLSAEKWGRLIPYLSLVATQHSADTVESLIAACKSEPKLAGELADKLRGSPAGKRLENLWVNTYKAKRQKGKTNDAVPAVV